MTETVQPAPRLALLALAAALICGSASAQSLRMPPSTALPSAPAAASGARAADHIVALVNSEPITASEVRARAARLEPRLAQQAGPMPSREAFEREVLELLIVERAQLQRAAQLGMRVDPAQLDQAERSIAEQNGLNLEQLRQRLREQGMDPVAFREEIRRDILLQRLREREVEAPLRVTDRDIDEHLLELRNLAQTAPAELNLGHVLVRVPEGAGSDVVAERLARAMRAQERARASNDFAAVAREFSDGPEASTGGAMGLRPAERYPDLFIDAVQNLPVGGVAGPLRSPAGFHVLKVLERQQGAGPDAAVTQTRARHILLRTGPQLDEQTAIARLQGLRQQLVAGADFAALAREFSQDGSAPQGGDLGWVLPGMFVPEFEGPMNTLAIGDISAPVVSRFGVHLIQVQERRSVTPSLTERRDMVRAEVREKLLERAYAQWARELRDRAFVEYREPRS